MWTFGLEERRERLWRLFSTNNQLVWECSCISNLFFASGEGWDINGGWKSHGAGKSWSEWSYFLKKIDHHPSPAHEYLHRWPFTVLPLINQSLYHSYNLSLCVSLRQFHLEEPIRIFQINRWSSWKIQKCKLHNKLTIAHLFGEHILMIHKWKQLRHALDGHNMGLKISIKFLSFGPPIIKSSISLLL